MRTPVFVRGLCVGLGLLNAAGLAIPATAQPESQPVPEGGKNALAGPKVGSGTAPRSIVEREFGGTLKRLEVRPEVAAVGVLELTEEERAKVRELFEARGKAVSRVLADNLPLFLEIQNARQSGQIAEARPKIREMHDAAAELLDPTLVERVCRVLPEAQVGEFRRLVTEYVDALSEQAPEAQAAGGTSGSSKQPVQDPVRREEPARAAGPRAAQRVEMNLLLLEMARALNALVAERRERTEELIRKVGASPEQEAQIRRILREGGEKNGPRAPGPDQRAEIMRKVMQVLTPEQRRMLIEERAR